MTRTFFVVTNKQSMNRSSSASAPSKLRVHYNVYV